MKKRFSLWSGRYLPIRGRVVLINSFLSSSEGYFDLEWLKHIILDRIGIGPETDAHCCTICMMEFCTCISGFLNFDAAVF
jgi:hypothetical protein